MTDKAHGHWQLYQPATPPSNAPLRALYARRDGDGVDWYDYVHSGDNFDPDSIKMTLQDNVVYAAVTDATLLFPENMDILEVFDVVTDDPQAMFGRKVYDPATGDFSDPPQPPPVTSDLEARLAALEAKAGGT